MNITTERNQEIWHDMQEPGSYEWWYFDAEDKESDLSFVIIWFAGFPFSPYYMNHYEDWKNRVVTCAPVPSDYSGFSFQLYENDRETLNFIREGRNGLFESNPSNIGARFEKNRFSYDEQRNEYILDIDFSFPARFKEVKVSLLFKGLRRLVYEKKDRNDAGSGYRHQWVLSVPRADVEGEIEIYDQQKKKVRTIPVKASGYHDHNSGFVPMQDHIARWHWGRAFSGRFNLVYYLIFFKNAVSKPLTLIILQDNSTGENTFLDRAVLTESNFRRGLFSPLHSRKLELRHENICLKIDHRRVLDAGPFYLRFTSSMVLEMDGNRHEPMEGISEFLDPTRLNSRFMRFFTQSRIWRDGEESLMYDTYNNIKRTLDWKNR